MTAAPHAFPAPDHDHAACVAAGLAQAEDLCRARGARLTDVRRRVLELLLTEGHRAVGAYDLLDRLNAGAAGKKAAPPAVYRALDFLVEQGLVHRIASLNAFVGCVRPRDDHRAQFLICRRCGAVAELTGERLAQDLAEAAGRAGFTMLSAVVEAEGLCPLCRDLPPEEEPE
ncbi:MAG: transcriptional repressor [Caenispirillum bisanense]|nr:transcriptional repressor [Caenispirillum bisanense]MCA1974685.1 transcriptional repressor [Caenispirillum sp.]